jgi:hypothetical protein
LDDKLLKEHLRKLLAGSEAHVDWRSALKGLRKRLRGAKPEGVPHSAWELLEHARIAQRDILEFCRNPRHVSPEWPSGYWPKHTSPRNAAEWERTVKAFRRDLQEMVKLVTNRQTNLQTPLTHGSGQTILREALLLADHNSYHLGQFVQLRRMLGSWTET